MFRWRGKGVGCGRLVGGVWTLLLIFGVVHGWVQVPPPTDGRACDLEIRKEVAPSPLVSGQQASFTITVRNVGTAPCPGPTTVTDLGGAGLSFVSASGMGWICIGQTCTYPGTIPAGGTVTVVYTYTVTASAGATVTNCAAVSNANDRNTANNQACVRSPVVSPPRVCDLTCGVTASPSPVTSGGQATFTITVLNVGTGPCATTTQVVVAPIPGLVFVSSSGTGWTCTVGTGQVICNYPGTIPPGGSASVSLTYSVTAPPGTVIDFCSSVANKDDSNTANNRCCTKVPVAAPEKCDLKCEKRIDSHPLVAGYLVTVVVTNVGSGVCPGPTTVTEHGIPGLTLVSASGSGWICAGGTCTYAGAIPPGGTAAVTYTYVGALPPGTTLENCVTIGNSYDVDVKNNCCAATASGPTCCCHLTYLGGAPDDFAPGGMEAHNPPPESHPEQTGPFVGFDGTTIDQWFGHRFSLPQGCTVTGAKLEIRVKPLGAGSDNDSLVLRIGGTQWIARFGPPGTVVLQTLPWNTASFPTGQTFTLDLGSLPGGGSLLADLNNHRLLDVIVQDDTSVDYVKLIVSLCNCP